MRFLVAGLPLVVFDLATKSAAVAVGPDRWPLVEPLRNPDLALGLIGLQRASWQVALVAAVAVSTGLHLFALTRSGQLGAWPLTLVVGGAAANGLDRLATGAVHDFLDLGIVVANAADGYLVAGLAGYVAGVWRMTGQPMVGSEGGAPEGPSYPPQT